MRLRWFRPVLAGWILAIGLGLSSVASAQAVPDDMLVDVALRDADLSTATRMLTQRTGIQFVFEPSGEPFAKITLQLSRQKASDAISYICKAAGAYFHRDENGVYVISHVAPKLDARNSDLNSNAAKVTVFRRIKLQKADARDVYMQILNVNPYDTSRMFNELRNFSRKSDPPPFPVLDNIPNNLPSPIQPQVVRTYQAPQTGSESGNDIQLPGDSANQGFAGGDLGGGGGGGVGGGFGGQGGGGGVGGGGGGGQGQLRGGFIPPGIDLASFDPTDNSLVVQGTEEAIDALQRIIAEFDRAPKQVEVKIEFVTTSSTVGTGLGYDVQFQRGSILFNSSLAPTQTFNPFFLGYSTGNLAMRLRAILTESRGHSVQAPTLRTMNNQPASISASTSTTIFLTQIQTTPSGNITTVTPQTLTATTGLAVTPRINNDGTITMFLAPQVQDFGQIRQGPNGQSIPDRLSQTISVVARVRNGETIALGGLNRKTDLATYRRFPILSEVPIIGQFFRQKVSSRDDTELIIFVTPTVIEDENDVNAGGSTVP